MKFIFPLFLALMLAFSINQSRGQVGQSKETLPISLADVRKAPTEIVIEGRSLTLSTFLWRDFMPGSSTGPDGSPMMAALKVATSDKKPFPSGVRMERLWVLFGEQVWETAQIRDRMNNSPSNKDSWILCSDLPVCEVTVRNGPKWGPGVSVDVIVQLTDKDGRHHLIQAPKQTVHRTD